MEYHFRFNAAQSEWSLVPSGVHHGSILSHLLFVIFINDVDTAVDVVLCALIKFADDTKGLHRVDSKEEAAQLQKGLDNLYLWSQMWQILFIRHKCHALHFETTNPRKAYTINNHPLLPVDEEEDFGVLINTSSNPSRQLSTAAMKGNQTPESFFLQRSLHVYQILKAICAPTLEFIVQVWSPWLQHVVNLLKNVQRWPFKSVSGLPGSYEVKLRQLKMCSLMDRCIRGDMIETYKLLHRIEDVELSTYLSTSAANHAYDTRLAVTVSEDGSITTPSYRLLRNLVDLTFKQTFSHSFLLHLGTIFHHQFRTPHQSMNLRIDMTSWCWIPNNLALSYAHIYLKIN